MYSQATEAVRLRSTLTAPYVTQEVGKNYFPGRDARLFKKAGHLDPNREATQLQVSFQENIGNIF